MVIDGDVTARVISDINEPGTYALNKWTDVGGGPWNISIVPDMPRQNFFMAAIAPDGVTGPSFFSACIQFFYLTPLYPSLSMSLAGSR